MSRAGFYQIVPAPAKRPAKPKAVEPETVEVRTPKKPGYVGRVNAAKYHAMRTVLLKVMPRKGPGLTQAEMMAAVGAVADANVFPGTTHMWWAKSVQLDLEARGELVRDGGRPLRWHRVR